MGERIEIVKKNNETIEIRIERGRLCKTYKAQIRNEKISLKKKMDFFGVTDIFIAFFYLPFLALPVIIFFMLQTRDFKELPEFLAGAFLSFLWMLYIEIYPRMQVKKFLRRKYKINDKRGDKKVTEWRRR